MAIAAVPSYMPKAQFAAASPAMRFGMLLALWERDGSALAWSKIKNKAPSLQQVCTISPAEHALTKRLIARQHSALEALQPDQAMAIQATSIAPFTTGLGNEHPLENGFAFLNPYGLPYLPGSGVKGVLRQAARELASGEWGASDWNESPRHAVPEARPPMQVGDTDILFGLPATGGSTDQLRGVLSFWDVIPQTGEQNLMVEVMTPHQSHYYQQDAKAGAVAIPPHDSGMPNPINFLTVPPQSGFTFHVVCDNARLQALAPDLAAQQRWKHLLEQAFAHAFAWLGFGAKTAVGYGAMQRDVAQEAKTARVREEAQKAAEQAARMASLSPQRQRVEALRMALEQRFDQLRGAADKPKTKDRANTALHAQARVLAKEALEGADWSADDQRAVAEVLMQWLPQVVDVEWREERKKLKLAVLLGNA